MINNNVRYNLDIPREVWEKFRKTLNKDDVINSVIMNMIKERIEKNKK